MSAFATVGAVGSSPALVTFGWSVGDANGDPLTCAIDGDGDGVDDLTVSDCQVPGTTRNIDVALPAGAVVGTTVTARLTVDDGTSAPVVATHSFPLVPGPSESFDITLRGVETLPANAVTAFVAAAERWEEIITRGVPDFAAVPTSCLPAGTTPIDGAVDDIVVDVAVVDLGGPGGVLGQAGPTCINTSTELALHGAIEFDSYDVPAMLSNGSFPYVVMHEMAHVLGVGTLWDETPYNGVRKIVQGVGGPDPVFSGTRGMAEWSRLGGSGYVPVENTGGGGTAGAHWRESVFDNELMTGWIESGVNPLSTLTIASLADLGYHVDLDQADAYTVPTWALAATRFAQVAVVEGTMLRPPVGRV